MMKRIMFLLLLFLSGLQAQNIDGNEYNYVRVKDCTVAETSRLHISSYNMIQNDLTQQEREWSDLDFDFEDSELEDSDRLLLDESGNVIGIAVLHKYESNDIELCCFALARQHRGNGISSMFLKKVICDISNSLTTRNQFWLCVSTDNHRAKQFYKKLAFVKIENFDGLERMAYKPQSKLLIN